jgi:ketosteroid isomerase-like protein
MSVTRAALPVLLAAACGANGQTGVKKPAGPDDIADKAASERVLADDLRATILDSYRALAEDYMDAYLENIGRGSRLMVIDVNADDVVVGDGERAFLVQRHFPEHRLEIVSKDLEVHISRDRTTAWARDDVSYRVLRDGRRAAIPLRMTAVFERADGHWRKLMEHVSYAVPDDEVLGEDAVVPAAAGKVPDGAAARADAVEARRVILALLADRDDARSKHVAVDDDAVLIAADPNREVRGAKLAEISTVRGLYGYDSTITPTGLRVDVSPSGNVAWAIASLRLVGARDGRKLDVPLRASFVLEKRDGVFRVVQTHVSTPLTPATLIQVAFGSARAR